MLVSINPKWPPSAILNFIFDKIPLASVVIPHFGQSFECSKCIAHQYRSTAHLCFRCVLPPPPPPVLIMYCVSGVSCPSVLIMYWVSGVFCPPVLDPMSGQSLLSDHICAVLCFRCVLPPCTGPW